MRVYFIRHGQTEWNRDKIVQGHTSVKLTEKGMKQAERVKETLSDVHFDRIIASDLYRTRQTAGIIFGEDANIEYDERVREINNTPVAGRTRDDLIAEFGTSSFTPQNRSTIRISAARVQKSLSQESELSLTISQRTPSPKASRS